MSDMLYLTNKILLIFLIVSICFFSVFISADEINAIKKDYCSGCHNLNNNGEQDYFSVWREKDHRASEKWTSDVYSGINRIDEELMELEDMLADPAELRELKKQVEANFHRVIHSSSSEEIQYMKQITGLQLSNLEAEVEAKLVHVKRLNILYILMLSVTMTLVAGISIYTMVMYMKRKR